MKANELKATDLMVGDWVMSKELKTPVKVCSIMNHYETTIYFCCQGNEFIVNSYQLEPIPLTPEILEKNGFETKKIMPFEQEFEHRVGVDGSVELDNRSEYIRSNNTWSMYIRGDRGFTSYIELSFLHELQHQLKHCKINKMITI